MIKTLCVELKESPSTGYVSVSKAFEPDTFLEEYDYYCKLARSIGNDKVEGATGFKLRFIEVDVKYDGRKGMKDEDILKTLLSKNLLIQIGTSGLFGGYYKVTDELRQTLHSNMQQRRRLAGLE